MFKDGDRLVCVTDKLVILNINILKTKPNTKNINEIFIFKRYNQFNHTIIYFKNEGYEIASFDVEDFILLKENRKKKLQKLCSKSEIM